jgi:cell division protein YceG involved in septum cleavage
MVELDNLKLEIKEYEAPLAELKSSLDLESKANRIAELSRLMEEPGFWDDPEKSQKDSQLLGDLRNDVNGYNDLEAKYKEKGLSLREGIILASIVQKEAKTADMNGVAQVFLNRLRVGMSLGSDVTAKYAADLVDPDRKTLISNADVLAYDSLYNTRRHTGLTPGPISNPGIEALKAVATGDDSKRSMLFFLTGDDGKMYYSDTEAGHNQNIRDHCQILCNAAL